MQSVSGTINQMDNEAEISRLRLIIGSLRDEAWRLLWAGLEMDEAEYNAETDRLLYGSK